MRQRVTVDRNVNFVAILHRAEHLVAVPVSDTYPEAFKRLGTDLPELSGALELELVVLTDTHAGSPGIHAALEARYRSPAHRDTRGLVREQPRCV